MQSHNRLLFLSSLGGILEFYDFIIYALFAGYIAKDFFPLSNPLTGLMVTFATFAIGYFARPLGGIIFGHFGDRIGRKATFTISILMMAISTLCIGLVPTYASIGIIAPIAIIFLRIMQGISVGGEIPGAITYVSESLHQRKGFACGIVFCALTMGIVLGSLVQATTTSIFTDDQMQSYGWRIPFIIGGIAGLLSYLLRRQLHESPQFLAIEKSVEKYPIITVCKQEFTTVIVGAIIVAVCAAVITSLFLFIPSYFSRVLNLPGTAYIWERTAAMALGSSLTIVFGYLSDKLNTHKMMLTLSVLLAVSAYPIFAIYAHYPELYVFAFILSAFLIGFAAGLIPKIISEMFPTNIRYSAIAASYNLGFALFGGLTPVISLSLVYYTDSVTSPAIYLIVVALLGLVASYFIRPRKWMAIESDLPLAHEVAE